MDTRRVMKPLRNKKTLSGGQVRSDGLTVGTGGRCATASTGVATREGDHQPAQFNLPQFREALHAALDIANNKLWEKE